MTMSAEQKQSIVDEYGKDSKDTGSTEVQIALLTARIENDPPLQLLRGNRPRPDWRKRGDENDFLLIPLNMEDDINRAWSAQGQGPQPCFPLDGFAAHWVGGC